MAYHYSNSKRASDPHALPNVETFRVSQGTPLSECPICTTYADAEEVGGWAHEDGHLGWYWQACFPGCLPDGEPIGPFATEAEALADAREGCDDDDDDDDAETSVTVTLTRAELQTLAMALADAQDVWAQGVDDCEDYDRTAEDVDAAGALEVRVNALLKGGA